MKSRKDRKTAPLRQKLNHCKSELEKYKKIAHEYEKLNKHTGAPELLAWFTYTVFLPEIEETEPEVIIKGDFNFKNTGKADINSPFICLKISPPAKGRLNGKIQLSPEDDSGLYASEERWYFRQGDWKSASMKNGEYWLTPVHCKKLLPDDILAFSNFELRVLLTSPATAVSLQGACFSEEITEGIRAINTCSLHF